MKKAMIVILHLALIGLTNGFWLVALVPLISWKIIKRTSRPSMVTNEDTVSRPRKQYEGHQFAQAASKGRVFSYASYRQGSPIEAPFAVIDLETTGLREGTHRVIEVALRKIDRDGNLIEEFATLINPETKDAGPTYIHGITMEDLLGAPKFSEVANLLLAKLSGSIAVAHHAAFEDRFLAAEFAKLGIGVKSIPCVDTLWLSRQVLDLPNYKLPTVADAFSIPVEDAHTALGDVRTLSKLLPILLGKSDPLKFLTAPQIFEGHLGEVKIKNRMTGFNKGEAGWISNLMKKLPDANTSVDNEVEIAYLELLSNVLFDGKLMGVEAQQLGSFAAANGLTAGRLRKIHNDYYQLLETTALSDGEISKTEEKTLSSIKKILGI